MVEAEPEQIQSHGERGMSLLCRVLVAVGAVEGAAGVALAAVSAHAVPSQALGSAANMLMVHAGIVVALALIAARSARSLARQLCLPGALIALGVALFAGAVSLRVLGGVSAPPGTAPIGGTITIIGWLTLLIPAFSGGKR